MRQKSNRTNEDVFNRRILVLETIRESNMVACTLPTAGTPFIQSKNLPILLNLHRMTLLGYLRFLRIAGLVERTYRQYNNQVKGMTWFKITQKGIDFLEDPSLRDLIHIRSGISLCRIEKGMMRQ